ncbi:hypothetical protein [Mesohalobacter halotolerans]|uniref:Uncharacterized protein n=1 Tax=Mesohalobacter halotolerans TaxID=1883405 RepID=A0A4U5TVU9_9FLAO|nr:hypothetical protein [Mesohalobacter halotolerans]TKS57348.1 hypothetical protein FCN74_02700 [Mesohalobacter halotolerans]
MSQINASKQSYNTLIIIIGIALLLYDFIANPDQVYFKIAGLVILMFGLYRSTKQWTSDNKSKDSDDSSEDHDNTTKKN